MTTNTDLVKINFSDDTTSMVVDVRRHNLSSAFFKKILAIPLNQYEIAVSNVQCAVDIINKTPPKHTWHYILNYLSILQLFKFDVDLTLLYDLVIPIEGLKLYFDLITKLFPDFESKYKNPIFIKCLETNFRPIAISAFYCLDVSGILKSILSKNKIHTTIKKTSNKYVDLYTGKNVELLCARQIEFSKNGHLVYYFYNNSCVNICGVRSSCDRIVPLVALDINIFRGSLDTTNKEHTIIKTFDSDNSKICLNCYYFLTDNLRWKHEISCKKNFDMIKYRSAGNLIVYYHEFGINSYIGVISQDTGELLNRIDIFGVIDFEFKWNKHNHSVDRICISNDNTMVAFVRSHRSENDHTCYIYNVESGKLVNKFHSDKKISCTSFYPNDKLLLIVCNNDITFKDIASGEIVYTIPNAPAAVLQTTFLSKNKFLHITTAQNIIYIYNFEKEQFVDNTD